MASSELPSWLTENGTVKGNKVARKDLAFWLPHTKKHLCDGLPYVADFESLAKIPVAQIGYILAIVIKIIRKNRVVGGARLIVYAIGIFCSVNQVNSSSPR